MKIKGNAFLKSRFTLEMGIKIRHIYNSNNLGSEVMRKGLIFNYNLGEVINKSVWVYPYGFFYADFKDFRKVLNKAGKKL